MNNSLIGIISDSHDNRNNMLVPYINIIIEDHPLLKEMARHAN